MWLLTTTGQQRYRYCKTGGVAAAAADNNDHSDDYVMTHNRRSSSASSHNDATGDAGTELMRSPASPASCTPAAAAVPSSTLVGTPRTSTTTPHH